MWSKTATVTTKDVTKEQMWKLLSDVNNWNIWDDTIEWAKLEGDFTLGNVFILRPKGGPNVKIKLIECEPCNIFTDCTSFFGAKMYGKHTFEDTPEGLRITITMHTTGILAWFWTAVVAKEVAKDLEGEIKKQISFASKL